MLMMLACVPILTGRPPESGATSYIWLLFPGSIFHSDKKPLWLWSVGGGGREGEEYQGTGEVNEEEQARESKMHK